MGTARAPRKSSSPAAAPPAAQQRQPRPARGSASLPLGSANSSDADASARRGPLAKPHQHVTRVI